MRKILLILAVVCTFSMGALADTFGFETPTGSTSQGVAVNALAIITTGAGTVTIDLTNRLTAAQVMTVAQNLSDLSFTLSSGTTGSVTSSSGTFINVGALGVVTSASSVSGSSTDQIGWALTGSSGNYLLNGLSGALAVPAQTIIGGTAGSFTSYTNAVGSIAANPAHNPFVQGTGEFVLSISGVTANTDVNSVVFSFGTSAGNNVPGTPVPEPGSVMLFGTGLLGLAGVIRRKHSR